MSTNSSDLPTLDISIYPNPAHEVFDITIDQNTAQGTVRLLNSIGQDLRAEIQQLAPGHYRVETKNIDIHPGIYFVEVLMGGRRTIRKIMLN